MGDNITIQGVRSLYGSRMDDLKIKKFNEKRINLARINIISIIFIISLAIHVLFLKEWFDISTKYEKMSDKIQSFEIHTKETRKYILLHR